MPRPTGRPNGLILHTEAFEALLAARRLLKKDVAADAGLSPQFVADLLSKRGGAHRTKAEALASSLGVKTEAIFPEIAGWVSPLPDRNARRGSVAS